MNSVAWRIFFVRKCGLDMPSITEHIICCAPYSPLKTTYQRYVGQPPATPRATCGRLDHRFTWYLWGRHLRSLSLPYQMWSCGGVGGFNSTGSWRLSWNTRVYTSIYYVGNSIYYWSMWVINSYQIYTSICLIGNGWVSPVNLHGAQHDLLTERSCFGELVEHDGSYFYIPCGLVRPSSTFTVEEAESVGHSDHRPTIARHPLTQLKWKKQKKIQTSSLPLKILYILIMLSLKPFREQHTGISLLLYWF